MILVGIVSFVGYQQVKRRLWLPYMALSRRLIERMGRQLGRTGSLVELAVCG